MSDDDLKFVIAADLNPTAMEEALKSLADKTDKVSSGFKGSMTGALSAFAKEAGGMDMSKLTNFTKTAKADARGLTVEELDKRLLIEEEIAKIIKAQQETTEKIKNDMDQDLLRARLTAEQEILKVKHEQALAEIAAQGDPDIIAKKVQRERELAKAKAELSGKEATEHREQERPGFFQKLMQDPKGSMGDIGKSLSGFLGGMKDEYKKGGVGGLADTAMSAIKGGGSGGGGGISKLLGAAMGGAEGGAMGAMGGAAAGAMGGPIGIAVAAGLEGIKVAGAGAAVPLQVLNSGLGALDKSFKDLQGPLGPITAGLNLLGSGFDTLAKGVGSIPIIGDLLGPMLSAFAAMPALINSITESLVSFAAKASPGHVKMLQIAVEDVQAVIGRSFIPVLEMLRDGVRLVGNAIATLIPTSDEVRSALNGLFGSLSGFGGQIRDMLTRVGPMVHRFFVEGLGQIGAAMSRVMSYVSGVMEFWTAIYEVYQVVQEAVEPLRELLSPLREAMGMGSGFSMLGKIFHAVASAVSYAAHSLRSFLSMIGLVSATAAQGTVTTSVGASAQRATIGGIDEYQKHLQESAYSMPGQATMAQVPSTVAQISTTLTTISDALRNLPAALARAIRDAATGQAGSAAQAAANAAGSSNSGLSGGLASALYVIKSQFG